VPGFRHWLQTPAGAVPQVATTLTLGDRLGACKARWGIGRLSYLVPPGLYALGAPGPESPVVVTANYKMSYDLVRQALAGRSVWLLVLETFGINVWCAAGKGSFGTEELIRRVKETGIAAVVSHRQLLLPILGAPGVAAHLVTKATGFSIRYATIRVADLPAYLDNGQVTTPAMRELTFTLYERLVLIPVELVHALKPTVVILLCLLVVGSIVGGVSAGFTAALAYVGAMLAGVVLGPLLLPWLPGRSFAVKGALAGLAWSGVWYQLAGGAGWSMPTIAAAFLALPAVSGFYTLNFTGCTPYTSRTGVTIEMRRALPAMGLAIIVGVLTLVAGRLG
jgi:acetyl-CoA decarbonylase/synthase complex subunit gamma